MFFLNDDVSVRESLSFEVRHTFAYLTRGYYIISDCFRNHFSFFRICHCLFSFSTGLMFDRSWLREFLFFFFFFFFFFFYFFFFFFFFLLVYFFFFFFFKFGALYEKFPT